MNTEQIKGALEGILFAMGEAVELGRLARAVGLEEKQTKQILDEMKDAYRETSRGIRLIELENAYQLCTKKEYYDTLIQVAKQPKKAALSEVTMETLAIVAYRQPVTKAEIEKIRGVKSDHAVNKLIEYGLIRELGRLDAPGRPILFGTTEEFLRTFGVQALDELPEVNPVQMADFQAEAEEELQMNIEV